MHFTLRVVSFAVK